MIHKVEAITTDLKNATLRVWTSSDVAAEVGAGIARGRLVGNLKNDPAAIAAKATELLQYNLDVHQLLSSLPDEDPDKHTDPARPDLFWQEIGGQMYLVGRSVVVTVKWTGELYLISCRNP